MVPSVKRRLARRSVHKGRPIVVSRCSGGLGESLPLVPGKLDHVPAEALELRRAVVAVEVLGSAAGEYEEAIASNRIVNPVEYQDARGFVWQADKLLASVGPDLAAKDADAVKAAQAAFEDLKQAWPSPLPPKAPVRDMSAVLAGMSKIELQIARFR